MLTAAITANLSGMPLLHAQEIAPAAIPSTQPSGADLAAQINAMQARLAEMQIQQQALERRQEVEATSKAVAKDADSRGVLFDGADFTAGFKNNRFVLQSADGNYVIRPWIHIQLRDTTNWRQDGKAGGAGDDTQNGFELRRARLGFDGNLFSPNFTYLINWATYRANSNATITEGTNKASVALLNGGLPVLEEAWGEYRIDGGPWALKAGQMHDPLDHEAIVGSKYRAPEASLQGDIFANTDTFTQGASLIYDPGTSFRVETAFTDGIRAANTDFRDYSNNGNAYDWGVASRVEYKFFGDWKDYNQLSALGNSKDLLVVGLGVDNSESGHSDTFSHTLDVQYGGRSGLFIYGSYFGRYISHNQGIALGAPVSTAFQSNSSNFDQDTYEYSFLGQVGYLIDQKWEPYIRYENMHLAGTPVGSHNLVQEISGGVNYYFHGQNAKFTGQLMYLPNGIPIDDTSSDVLGNNGHSEFVFMAQFQLLL